MATGERPLMAPPGDGGTPEKGLLRVVADAGVWTMLPTPRPALWAFPKLVVSRFGG